jgi:hypothetical protein
MSRLVLDVLFLDHLEFSLSTLDYSRCSTAWSREEVLRKALEGIGLELIDYGSFIVQPRGAWRRIEVYSKAYRERAERATLSR